MNFKTTYIMFAVLVGLVTLFGLVLLLNPSRPIDTNFVLPSLHDTRSPVKADDINTVIIERTRPKAEKLVFMRDKENPRWHMTEPLALRPERVDRFAVDRVVDQVLEARREEHADVKGPLKEWGLDTPAATITIKKDDKEWKLNIGEVRKSTGGATSVVYVTSSDHPNEPMAVKLNQLEAADKAVPEFRAKETLAEHAFDITAVNLRDGKNPPVILQKQGNENRWRFQQPAYGEADYDGEPAPLGGAPGKTLNGVRSLLEMIAALKVEFKAEKDAVVVNDFVSEDGRNLDQYGLDPGDKPGRLRIEVTRNVTGPGGLDKKQTVTDALLIGKKADEKGDKVFAMLESDKYVIKVPAANLEAITKVIENPSLLRDRDLVHLDEQRVDAVAIKNQSGSFELFKSGTPAQWKLFRESQGSPADDASVRSLLTAVNAKRQVKEFPDPAKVDDKALQLDAPVATLSLWVDGIQKEEPKKEEKKDTDKKETTNKEEKKDVEKKPEEEKKDPNAKPKLKSDEPTVRLLFGKRENGVVYVRRKSADDNTVVTVPDTLLDKVNLGPMTYADRTLPSFTEEVTKVLIDRGGVVTELEKEKDKPAWTFKQPMDYAGRPAQSFAVEGIINGLRQLRAEKLIAEKASPELQEQYGLKTPSVKVTLVATKDNKPEEHVYLFGKDTDEGTYAKLGDRDLIFQVNKTVLSRLSGELREQTVFSFDRNKVKALKVTAWQDVVGSPYTLDLERKSPTEWTVKAPAGYNLDPAKAEEFITSLSFLRAEQFLNPKTGPQPEKMEGKDGAMTVEITVEGEKDPLTLTLGGEAPDKRNYFARSNKVPNEAFLVAKAPFEKYRQKPVSFAK
jgi:hypothetical protein